MRAASKSRKQKSKKSADHVDYLIRPKSNSSFEDQQNQVDLSDNMKPNHQLEGISDHILPILVLKIDMEDGRIQELAIQGPDTLIDDCDAFSDRFKYLL